MSLVVNQIQSMGIEVLHILAGCTYLCRPIDVGVNKPIKLNPVTSGRNGWWKVEGGGIVNGKAMEPSRKMVAAWVIDVYNNIPTAIGRNARKKTGLEWF